MVAVVAASTVELTLRMLVSLAVIGAVVLLGARVAQSRLRPGGVRPGIEVHARRQLTKANSVAVIRAGGRALLIGMNDATLTVLAEGEDLLDELDGDGPVAEGGSERESESEGLDLRSRAVADARETPIGADGKPKGGAWRRHGRADGTAVSGMSVIEALRERTVRRG